ncbi:MAG: YbaB/EbfC family nucleoid-associated protein [Dehalococcoidia bacterium]|nr:YbaB/EbfC family nucleoid-associated protein [Dehalococcoidia bacterium]
MSNRQFMRQAQQLQAALQKAQEELETATVEATAGGGVVRVVVTGKGLLQSVKIDPQAVDPKDVAMLEELVLAAVNEGQQKAQEMAQRKLGALTGGLKLPGL